MPSRIRVLDSDTIDKIAAGEVVERPSSVVKELVENALDSGATSISIRVEDGGRKSVSIRDDGCGMSPTDAVLAFQRHATSKIISFKDLERLDSFGFRGEALSSIAAVSRITLRTREHDNPVGAEVVVDNGKLERSSAAGCPPGTEVTAEDIFAKIPARRKSLRSKTIELAGCREVALSYVLCRPDLSVSFQSDGETVFVHSPAEGMNGSLATVFGPKVAENMLRGEAEGDGVRVDAYLGRLEHTRSSNQDLRLFVNDRPVRSQKLVSTVIEAYGSRLMKDRYPLGAVMLRVDSAKLDVNVHPAKREVRFGDDAAVKSLVSKCVSSALVGKDLSQKFDLTGFSDLFSPETVARETQGKPREEIQAVLEVPDEAKVQRPHAIIPLAQIMNTYILAETAGNLMLVDQHAASERVVYEGVLRAIEEKTDVSQNLLTPLVLNLSASEEQALEENRKSLEKAGFDVEKFGKDAHAIRAIPTVLGVAQGESAFRNILGDLSRMAPAKKLGLEVIWKVACHTAVRAGDPLTPAQMRELLADLAKTENPYTCEHGRPTMIVLSQVDLEKLFKRRV